MVLFVILTQNSRSITFFVTAKSSCGKVTTLSLLYIFFNFYFLLVASAFYSLKMREKFLLSGLVNSGGEL